MADLRQLVQAIRSAGQLKEVLGTLSEQECEKLLYDWRGLWARPEQLPPPGSWTTWVIDAGRGFGKTRSGAEFVREQVDLGNWGHVALVARTPRDARKVMIEGESGLLNVWPASMRPTYNPSLATVTFWNGATASIYSDEVPDQLRGPQHHGAWVDEFAKFRNPLETWDQLQFGLRLGRHPRTVVTTTPRPLKVFEDILAEATTVRTTGSTYDNWANLPASFKAYIKKRYEGTSLGEQEIFARHLKDAEGALWSRALIERNRVASAPLRGTGLAGPDGREIMVPEFRRVVLGVDPAVTAHEGSDETGLVLAGLGKDDRCYILDDATNLWTPAQWARMVCEITEGRGVDLVVGEVNNGGDLVETNIRGYSDENGRRVGLGIPYKSVRASRGKDVRAEPVKSLYEQGRVKHVGILGQLEDEMCTWVPGRGKSPNRVDATVWAVTELMLGDYVEYKISVF